MYVVWVYFMREQQDLQFKVGFGQQIFEKLFMVILVAKEIFLSYFVLLAISDLGFEPQPHVK